MKEVLEMSNKELERYRVLTGVSNGEVSQVKAAELLGISDRQVRNLLSIMKTEGAKGLISKKRRRPSNHRTPEEVVRKILSIVREKYEDFGPSFAREKLETIHGIAVSKESLRKWMTGAHIWNSKCRRVKTHPTRRRRECFGEVIQVDGSHEFWFEDRGELCVLLVFIDDATGRITSLYFSKGETLAAYFKALEIHLRRFGIPRNIYSDRFRVFDSPVEDNLTQFKRALKTLGINSILANSPQAKGRVERANRTLQDRLIKEMRLRGISTMEAANEYVNEFIEMYNQNFSKEPVSQFNAHRPLETTVDLPRILSRYEERTVTKDGVFQFHNRFYKIIEEPKTTLRGKKVEVRIGLAGKIRVFLGNEEQKAAPIEEVREFLVQEPVPKLRWEERAVYKPSPWHPWKRWRPKHRPYGLLQKFV